MASNLISKPRLISLLPSTIKRWYSVPLTVEKFPHFKRNTNFAKLTSSDIEYFQSILPANRVVTTREELDIFNTDWLKKYRGQASVILKPKNSDEVSKILAYCNNKKLPVVPQGGNTGLVGGSIPVFDEIIISMSNMNQIQSFDDLSGILICEAGCILENLDKFLAEKGYIMPLDLGAKGSCQIGGNVSTNAGGLRLLRYGSLHGSVLGLEYVLPNGHVIDNLSTLRKDNTGYDLKQLFIGSEGTLGIITKVSILTPKRSKFVNAALLGFSSYEKILEAFKVTREESGEILSAFEFFDRGSLDLTMKYIETRDPLPTQQKFYSLIETSGSNETHDSEKINSLLEVLMQKNIADDGVVAQDSQQIASFWKIREGITGSLAKHGEVYKYDLSVPVNRLYELVEVMKKVLKNDATTVVGYGHMGDGNLHLNVTSPKYNEAILKKIEPFVYEWTSQYKGSISAEHGLGVMKAPYLHYSKSPDTINLMKQIKNLFDPNGIMNPYKYLP